MITPPTQSEVQSLGYLALDRLVYDEVDLFGLFLRQIAHIELVAPSPRCWQAVELCIDTSLKYCREAVRAEDDRFMIVLIPRFEFHATLAIVNKATEAWSASFRLQHKFLHVRLIGS